MLVNVKEAKYYLENTLGSSIQDIQYRAKSILRPHKDGFGEPVQSKTERCIRKNGKTWSMIALATAIVALSVVAILALFSIGPFGTIGMIGAISTLTVATALSTVMVTMLVMHVRKEYKRSQEKSFWKFIKEIFANPIVAATAHKDNPTETVIALSESDSDGENDYTSDGEDDDFFNCSINRVRF